MTIIGQCSNILQTAIFNLKEGHLEDAIKACTKGLELLRTRGSKNEQHNYSANFAICLAKAISKSSIHDNGSIDVDDADKSLSVLEQYMRTDVTTKTDIKVLELFGILSSFIAKRNSSSMSLEVDAINKMVKRTDVLNARTRLALNDANATEHGLCMSDDEKKKLFDRMMVSNKSLADCLVKCKDVADDLQGVPDHVRMMTMDDVSSMGYGSWMTDNVVNGALKTLLPDGELIDGVMHKVIDL